MDLGYIEKRQEELKGEFDKGAKALQELQKQANGISEQMKQIQGAFIELENQKKELDNGGKKDKKSSKAKS